MNGYKILKCFRKEKCVSGELPCLATGLIGFWARSLALCLKLPLVPYIVCTNSKDKILQRHRCCLPVTGILSTCAVSNHKFFISCFHHVQ